MKLRIPVDRLQTGIRVLKSNSTAAAIIKNLTIRVGVLLLNFGTGMLLARSLGATGRGEQTAISLWPGFIATMFTIGLPTALNFHSSREPESAKRLYMSSALAMLLVGVTASVVGAAAMPLLLHGYNSGIVRTAQLLMIFTPETLVASAARAHLEANEQFTRSTLGLFFPNVATLIVIATLVVFHQLSPVSAALCYLAPTAFQSTWIVSRLWKTSVFRIQNLAPDIRLLLPYGLQCYALDIVSAVSGQIDLVIILSFLHPRELGLYTVALSVSRIINIVPNAVAVILFPRASSLRADDAVELVLRAVRVSTATCIGAGVLFYFVLQALLPTFYGSDFREALPLVRLLIPEAILTGLATILSQSFMATNKPGVVTIVQLCWIAVAVGLLFFCVPRMSIIGAAVALVIAAFVRVVLTMYAYPLIIGHPIPGVILRLSDIAYLRSFLLKRGFVK